MDQEDLINAYLDGKLPPEDKLIFEKLLQEQPEYQLLVEEQRRIKIAVTLQERKDLRDFLQQLNETEKAVPKTTATTTFKSWLYSGVAACLIVLAGLFLWTNLSMDPGQKLYKTYYETYPNLIAPTVRGESASNLKADAFLAYDNGDYQRAAILFENLQQEPDSDYALFYQGICQLELSRPEKAIPLFERMNENSQNPDKITANWYAALGYFQLLKLEEGKSLMAKVAAKTGHPFQPKAQEIMSKLK